MPVETVGEAVGVKTNGGVLEHVLFKVKARGLAFIPIDFTGEPNKVDCAIAILRSGPDWENGEAYGIGIIRRGSTKLYYRCKIAHISTPATKPNTGKDYLTCWEDISVADKILELGLTSTIKEAEIGELVCKVGRTTGYTEEYVWAIDGLGTVTYDKGDAFFEDCIVTGDMVRSGDSGSLLVDKCSKRPVGLVFASIDGLLACHIKANIGGRRSGRRAGRGEIRIPFRVEAAR